MTQLVGIVTEDEVQKIPAAVLKAPAADLYEIRIDYLKNIDKDELGRLKYLVKKPLIFTLRTSEQGGKFNAKEGTLTKELKKLAALNPDYLDIEADLGDDIINELHQDFPAVKIIRSYHNFIETPESLDSLLTKLQHPHVFLYKIITTANNTIDNLTLLHFIKHNTNNTRLVAHSMGPLNLVTRVAGALVGNFFTYAAIKPQDKPAPECPNIELLTERYGIKKINEHTKLYALLGDPVEHSIGDQFHNYQFKHQNFNAVYLKLKLTADELKSFFAAIKTLPFKGFSVTTPFKRTIIPYIDKLTSSAKTINAVNTISIKQDQCFGTNTDGIGALDALHTVYNKKSAHVLILGAGASASAIAIACQHYTEWNITIVNRTLEQAKILAQKIAGQAFDFNTLEKGVNNNYDIIINTIPLKVTPHPLMNAQLQNLISEKTLIMNIDYSAPNHKNLLSNYANQATITPEQMFTYQAKHQLTYWLGQETGFVELEKELYLAPH